MKHISLLCFALLLIGCNSRSQFTITGSIKGAEDKVVYLQHTALTRTTTVDSCVINADGTFTLQAESPAHPDFYRLELANRQLILAVDSIETIIIRTTLDSMAHTTNILGSEPTLQIAQLRATARTMSTQDLREHTKRIIASNPASLVAYYAVFMKQNGQYIWNINEPLDRRMYQAVATSFNLWMPEYERTKSLCSQVLEVIQGERNLQTQQAMRQLIAEAENTFLDINLPDENDQINSLSQLKGKVILLDFSTAEMEHAVAYTFELRELYNKYHKKGLQIYSVAFDRNRFAWQEAAANLPWVTVRADKNNIGDVLMKYNIQSLPTIFLMDRKGEIQGRYTDFKALETDINKYL